MMFKKQISFACLLSLLVVGSLHAQDSNSPEELTGDVKLACEAILCLSSADRPSECSPSIKKYYSIKADKWKDTIKKRRNFLKLCPASSEAGMPDLVEAILDGAGFCDATELNQHLVYAHRIYKKSSRSWGAWADGKNNNYPECGSYDDYESNCVEHKQVIDNNLPARCMALINHELTYYTPLQYVGDKYNGGKWVDNAK